MLRISTLLLALVLASPVWAQGFIVPRGPIPPHVQTCMADSALYQGLVIHRLAGLTREEAKVSLGFSMRILAYTMETDPRPKKMTIEEAEADAMSKLNEIYDMEPFSRPIANAWGSRMMQECIDDAEADFPPPEPDWRERHHNAEKGHTA